MASAADDGNVVNIYSARHYDTDLALYERFEERTGVRVNLIEGGSDGLIERIVNEAEFSPADLLITVDAGRLWRAQQAGVLQPVDSAVLKERIPAHLRDPGGHWFGLSKRARVIVYNKAAGLPEGISRYEDLADPRLGGKVCMRSSGNIYNLSLLGSLIEHNGEESAGEWANGVVANFRRQPQGNDTAQLRAVAAGECEVSIANTYYIGRLLGSDNPQDRLVAEGLGMLFPNQGDRGTHVNISGAGVTRHAPHRDNAVKFLEYLTGDDAQRLFAEGNNEYPVVGPASGPIATLGEFKEDAVNAAVLGANQSLAVKTYDRAGWR
ncbi:MAG: Fe(3+) ABC transporter substrate-binding protein [Gammaproteobacteria bacterium]|nr:Fe(3+) ABC transporter substrate-binding protein [Gammaproteobacteria bacterium]